MREKQFYEVDVLRSDDEGEIWWGGEGGLEDESVGVDFDSTPELEEFIGQVEDELDHHRKTWPDLTVKWTLDHGPADELLEIARREGIELP